MNNETKILLDEYKEEFKNYKAYLDANNWFDDVYFNERKGKLESTKLNTEVSIIDTIIKSTNKFKEDVGDDIDKKPIQDFIKLTSEIITRHIERVQRYKRTYPLDEGSVESEVEFHSDLFALITKTKVALSKLNIDENEQSRKSLDLFFGNQKAPLMMRKYLCDNFQVISDKTEKLEIDFSVPHINPATSNEMLINMKPKDIPKWDPNKHFFEQEVSTIQFWEEERNKMINGVNIGGYKLSPWLYWHTNVYKMAFGSGEEKGIKLSLFRDNEFFFDYMHNKAKAHGTRGVFMYGSRRFAKSAGMTSRLLHGMWTIEGAKGTVQGFSKVPDLEAIITYANDAIQNMFPALKIPANSLTLEDGIVLGLKGKKVQDRYDFANLTIVNLEGGTSKKGTQKTAGSTPDMFLLDEAGKGKCIPPWKAAIPSFAGGRNGTWRVVPLISGTAGEGTLSVDAELMLKDPETYSILPMDWDFLEEFVDPDYVTWNRNSFGFFIPAQMSLAAPDKIIMPFGDFLDKGLDTSKFNKDLLNEIDIHVTNWADGKDFFEGKRNAISNDIVMLAGETNSFPLDPEDCYLTTEINKFPGLESKARKSFVEKHGLDGQKYRLYRDAMGEIHADMTTDPVITDYPYKGGNFDAPVVMLENPLLFDTPPPLGLYTIGFDDVKQEKSDGDSVISACVYKRGYEGGEWADRFVAWFDSRPDRKQEYYRTLYLIIKIFNARILMENADNGFLEWMELNHMDDVHIHFSTGVGLASEENLNLNKNRRFGWAPTPLNIYRLEQKLVMYAKEDNVKIGDVEGLSGIDRINYTMLLEEMYKYKKDKNADRIRTAGLALTLAQYYDKTYQYMKRRKHVVEFEGIKKSSNWKNTRGLSNTNKLTKW